MTFRPSFVPIVLLNDLRPPLRDERFCRRVTPVGAEDRLVRSLSAMGDGTLAVVAVAVAVVVTAGAGVTVERGWINSLKMIRGKEGTRVCELTRGISGGFAAVAKTEARGLGGSLGGVVTGVP